MGFIQQEEKPTILGKIISILSKVFLNKENWFRIIFGWLALVLIILCVTISLYVYKFDSTVVQKKYESIIVKKILNHMKSPLIRRTTNGLVEGIEQTTALGQKFYSFRGIPFAEPPITGIDPYTGEQVDRRFKPPVPIQRNWTETLKAHDFREFCQPSEVDLPSDIQNYKTSEDCLFMNVFVPAGGAEKKSVFVYIHGAGPGGGITDLLMDPDFMLAQDNIVVYLTFRVQIFGFLNLGFGNYTGNMALKDQQLGIKWVYDNIEFFSGNKDQILLFGDSIGASMAHAHMLNAESRKYFTRAYMVSGTVSPWKLRSDNHLSKIQKCLDFNGTHTELLDYMKSATSTTLAKCNHLLWVLYIESPNATAPFITKTPDEIYNSDSAPVMDAMFTFASQESIKIYPDVTDREYSLFDDWRKSKIKLAYANFTEASHPNEHYKAMEKLKKAYSPTNSNDLDEIRRKNIAYLSDAVVSDNVLKTVASQANANTRSSEESRHKKTFLVRVSMHSDLNAMETQYKKIYDGATHSDDLCYMFYCGFLDQYFVTVPHIVKRDHVYDMIVRNVQRMTNFARYGDPSTEGDTPFKSCQSSNEIYCHEVSNELKTRITIDIKEQLNYDMWREIDDIYRSLSIK